MFFKNTYIGVVQ